MSFLRFSFLQHITISCFPLLTDIHFFHTLSCSSEFWTLINSLATLNFRIASASWLSVLNCDIGQTNTFTSKVCLLTLFYVPCIMFSRKCKPTMGVKVIHETLILAPASKFFTTLSKENQKEIPYYAVMNMRLMQFS